MAVSGIDVSRHQGTVDFAAVKRAGHQFAILKATEGTSYTYIDWFRTNAPKARAAGLVVGAYHFLRADRNPAEQARYFLSTVKSTFGSADGVILVVDVELAQNGTGPQISHVLGFASEFRKGAPGHPLVVYTGRWYWVGHMGNPRGADIGPLWHSEYDTGAEYADGPELDNYGGWPGCTIWQHTSSGSVPGVSGNCDMNVLLRGTLADLTGEDDMTPDEMVGVLNSEARKVPGIVSNERYMEVMLETVRAAKDAAEQAKASAAAAAIAAGTDHVDEAVIGTVVAQAIVPAVITAITDQLPDEVTVNLDVAVLTQAAEDGALAALRKGTG